VITLHIYYPLLALPFETKQRKQQEKAAKFSKRERARQNAALPFASFASAAIGMLVTRVDWLFLSPLPLQREEDIICGSILVNANVHQQLGGGEGRSKKKHRKQEFSSRADRLLRKQHRKLLSHRDRDGAQRKMRS
jgi:hypothetical protein